MNNNDKEMESFFYTERVTLSRSNSNFNEFAVVKTAVALHYNPYYSD